jgi:uncharacterized membrane protein HdeD (DUF308 family)
VWILSNVNDNGESPRWWLLFRRIVIFLLGVLVILDSLYEKDTASVGKLVVGIIMIGVLPLDDLVRLIPQRPSMRRGDIGK